MKPSERINKIHHTLMSDETSDINMDSLHTLAIKIYLDEEYEKNQPALVTNEEMDALMVKYYYSEYPQYHSPDGRVYPLPYL